MRQKRTVPEPPHDLPHIVRLTHGDPAGGEDGVRLGGGLGEGLLQGGRVVPHHAQVQDLQSQVGEDPVEGVAVAVVDLPGLQGSADGGELVAGGEEGHPGAAVNRHLGEAERGQQSQLRRPDASPGEECRAPNGQVLPRAPYVLAGFGDGGEQYGLALHAGGLLHDHGIRPAGEHGPGHHPHRLSRSHQAREGPAGKGGTYQLQAVFLCPPVQMT